MHEFIIKMAKIFKTLGDPTRLKIIRSLASKMENRLSVTDLAQKIGMSQPAVSQHIRRLSDIEILYPQREGMETFYHINIDILKEYKNLMDNLFELAFEKCPNQEKCFNIQKETKANEL